MLTIHILDAESEAEIETVEMKPSRATTSIAETTVVLSVQQI